MADSARPFASLRRYEPDQVPRGVSLRPAFLLATPSELSESSGFSEVGGKDVLLKFPARQYRALSLRCMQTEVETPDILHFPLSLLLCRLPSGGCEARRAVLRRPGVGKAVKIRRGRAAVKDVARISIATADDESRWEGEVRRKSRQKAVGSRQNKTSKSTRFDVVFLCIFCLLPTSSLPTLPILSQKTGPWVCVPGDCRQANPLRPREWDGRVKQTHRLGVPGIGFDCSYAQIF